MIIQSARFVVSNTSISKCPETELPEYAFIGRSNVGKSSLINALLGVKGLAKTSSTPGKTRLINHFLVNEQWFLVDLPGYGYARISKNEREKWEKMTHNYLKHRENLVNTFVLIDSRLDPQEIDLKFIQWLGENDLPFTIVFTKTDKKSGNQAAATVAAYRAALAKSWDELPQMILTSAQTQEGKEEILGLIDKINGEYAKFLAQES